MLQHTSFVLSVAVGLHRSLYASIPQLHAVACRRNVGGRICLFMHYKPRLLPPSSRIRPERKL